MLGFPTKILGQDNADAFRAWKLLIFREVSHASRVSMRYNVTKVPGFHSGVETRVGMNQFRNSVD